MSLQLLHLLPVLPRMETLRHKHDRDVPIIPGSRFVCVGDWEGG